MGACIEVSRGTAYGLSLSQMALGLGAVLFFPGLRVQVFAPQARLVNGTLPADSTVDALAVHVILGGPVLFLCAITLWYSFLTMNLHDKGSLSSDYTQDGLAGAGFWDSM